MQTTMKSKYRKAIEKEIHECRQTIAIAEMKIWQNASQPCSVIFAQIELKAKFIARVRALKYALDLYAETEEK